MSCACGRKKNGTTDAAMEREANQLLLPTQWGPIMWKLLHVITEKIGQSGSNITDMDQANYVKTMITMLPSILPCADCQAHAEIYLAANPFPVLKNLYGPMLQHPIRTWLYTFHNHVRTMKGQDIIVSLEECSTLYGQTYVSKAEYTTLIECIVAATRQLWVKLDQWKKWYSVMERLRLLTGTIVAY
jgi:hypothetical protein